MRGICSDVRQHSWLSTVVRGCSGSFTATPDTGAACHRTRREPYSAAESLFRGDLPSFRGARGGDAGGGINHRAEKLFSCPSVSIGSGWFRSVRSSTHQSGKSRKGRGLQVEVLSSYCRAMPSSRHLARPTAADQPLPFGPDADPESALGRPATAVVADVREPELVVPSPALESEAVTRPADPSRSPSETAGRARRSGRRPGSSGGGGLTGEQRVLRARLAAYHLHATHDPRETTRRAREVFLSRFEREVDPDGVLTPGERARRAEAARRAYFTRLAFQSSRARRRTG